MRSDMKIGLICVFAIVLGVVIYFVAQGNNTGHKAQAATGTPATGAASPPSNALATPPAPAAAATPTALPPSGTTAGPALASANGGSMGGGFIAAPGSTTTAPGTTTAPAASLTGMSTPSTPGMGGSTTTGMGGSTPTGLGGGTPLNPPYIPSSSYGSHPGSTGSTGTGATLEIGGGTTPSGSSSFGSSGLGTGGLGTGSSLPGLATGGGMATTHKIEKGDMLGTIAKKYGVSVKAIEEANKGIDSTRLKVGTTINIPAASATVASTKPATTKPAKATASTKPAKPTATGGGAVASGSAKAGSSYVVKKGDTLSTIARAAYGATGSWHKIYDANHSAIPDPNVVAVGTELKIPQ